MITPTGDRGSRVGRGGSPRREKGTAEVKMRMAAEKREPSSTGSTHLKSLVWNNTYNINFPILTKLFQMVRWTLSLEMNSENQKIRWIQTGTFLLGSEPYHWRWRSNSEALHAYNGNQSRHYRFTCSRAINLAVKNVTRSKGFCFWPCLANSFLKSFLAKKSFFDQN